MASSGTGKPKSPECWGEYAQDAERCAACQYAEACRWCGENPDADASSVVRRDKHTVSYESLAYSSEVAVEDEPQDEARTDARRDDLLAILAFLARVDDYTLEILSSVLGGNATTSSGIARELGISRQAVHRRLGWAVEHYPELRPLLNVYLRRCERIVSARRERTAGIASGRKPAKHIASRDDRRSEGENRQLEFF